MIFVLSQNWTEYCRLAKQRLTSSSLHLLAFSNAAQYADRLYNFLLNPQDFKMMI